MVPTLPGWSGAPEVFVRLPHSWCGASVEGVSRVAEAAEALGFDGVSVQDHLLSSRGTSPCGHRHEGDDRSVLESFATLSFVAARTSRVKLVTGVLVLPFRNVLRAAQVAASIDVLSKGRLVLGVAGGWPRGTSDPVQRMRDHAELAARETDLFDPPSPRGRYLDEQIAALDRLWQDDDATFRGDFLAFEGVDLRPRPIQRPRPPIWVGGRAEATHRRAALLADGWFPSQASVEVLAAGRDHVLEHSRAAGRPDPRIAVNLFVSIDRDGAAAREVVRDGLSHRFASEAAMFGATIAGTPAEVRDRMHSYVEAGCSAFDLKILPLATGPTLAQVELLAREVLPPLRHA